MKRLGLFVGAVLAAASMYVGAFADRESRGYFVPEPIRHAAAALCDADMRAMWTTLDSELQSEFDSLAAFWGVTEFDSPLPAATPGEAAFYLSNDGSSTCVSYQYVGQYTDEDGNAKVVYAYTFISTVVWYIFTGNAAEGYKVAAIE